MAINFKDDEIRSAARNISSLTRAGMPQDEICSRMVEMQKKKADFWLEAVEATRNGQPLSRVLDGHWPNAYLQAVKAGEDAGTLADVLREVNFTIVRKQEIMKLLKSALQPLGFLAGGMGILIFFLVSVIPSLPAPRGVEPSLVRSWSDWLMGLLASDQKYIFFGAIGAVLFGFYSLLKTEGFKNWALSVLDQIPNVGLGVRSLLWAIFARYLIVLSNAGGNIDLSVRLRMASESLPPMYREEVDLLIDDLNDRSMGIAAAVNPERQDEGDPRRKWPLLFTSALMNYEATGDLGHELQQIVEDLEDDGKEGIKGALALTKLFGMLVAAASIMFPMASYLMETVASTQALS